MNEKILIRHFSHSNPINKEESPYFAFTGISWTRYGSGLKTTFHIRLLQEGLSLLKYQWQFSFGFIILQLTGSDVDEATGEEKQLPMSECVQQNGSVYQREGVIQAKYVLFKESAEILCDPRDEILECKIRNQAQKRSMFPSSPFNPAPLPLYTRYIYETFLSF